jgi:hypothetical protein
VRDTVLRVIRHAGSRGASGPGGHVLLEPVWPAGYAQVRTVPAVGRE